MCMLLRNFQNQAFKRWFPPLTGPLVLLGIGLGLVIADHILGAGYVPANTILSISGYDKASALGAVAQGAGGGWLTAVLLYRFWRVPS